MRVHGVEREVLEGQSDLERSVTGPEISEVQERGEQEKRTHARATAQHHSGRCVQGERIGARPWDFCVMTLMKCPPAVT
jgi:hypothetical protein